MARTTFAALGLLAAVGCSSSPTEVCDKPCAVPLAVRVVLGSFPIDEVVVEVTGPGIGTPLGLGEAF